MKAKIRLVLLVAICLITISTSQRTQSDENFLWNSRIPELSDDGFSLMEPAVVPEPREGERWWYAPSHRTRFHSHRSKTSNARQKMTDKTNENLRLPGDFLPSVYAIRIMPFIEEGNFTTAGQIDIFVDCLKGTNNITLHAINITVDQSSILVRNMNTRSLVDVRDYIDEQSSREMITIQTVTELNSGNRYKISMNFTSLINEEPRGFYRSSYEEDGVKKWFAVTQMEPSEARRTFPCFDEPNMKANFSIVIGRKDPFTSASNMRLLASVPIEKMPGYYWDYFQTSVPMSSYLVAFLVSDLEEVESTTVSKSVPFRAWVRPESRNLSEYSLNKAVKIQEYYSSFLGFNYSLPKQDLLILPEFSLVAMENWGLITFSESALLIDVQNDSFRQMQSALQINAHQLAHQWFGNLVTAYGWDTNWLKEGLATYYEYYGANVAEYEFRMLEQFVLNEFHYAFVIDALETSRPMDFRVSTRSEISQTFDAISYSKAACVIQMCEDFLGWSTFNRGMTRYLNNSAYGNVSPDDLWQAMQEQADKDRIILPTTVKEIMDTWTTQMGFPLINVTRNYVTGNVTVSQKRFLQRQSANSSDTHEYRWWVPLTYYSRAYLLRKTEWLSNQNESIVISGIEAGPNDWLVFNYDQRNYYRVAYDEENYRLIAEQLIPMHGKFSDNNLAQLLDDAFVLASAHLIPYKSALNLSSYLKIETRYVPWHAVLDEFDYIDNMLHSQRQYPDWKNYLTSLVLPYYNYLGFNEYSDSIPTIYARNDAITWACRLDIPDCVENVRENYALFMNDSDNNQILSPNQRTVILRAGVEHGGFAEWEFAINQYIETLDTTFLVAATRSKDSSSLYKLLEMMLDDGSGIPLEDVNMLFNNVASNSLGNALATKFLINRWDDIEKSRLKTNYFVNFFRYLCNRQNTQEQLDTLLKLRNDHVEILGNSNTVQQGIDVVLENIKWMRLHQNEIGYWLIGEEEPTTTESTTTTTIQSTITTTIPSTSTVSQSTITSTTPSTNSASTSSNSQMTTQTTTTPASGANPIIQMNLVLLVAVASIGTYFA